MMLEQNDRKATPEQAPAPQVVGPATPKKTEPLAVDELRDEFLRNAPEVATALRQKGKGQEATQLEQAAKLIGVAVGAQPPQPTQADALQGESVSSVLKNIWDVIDKDPELKKMPQAQSLRRSGKALDDAGLLNITIRNGVVVSFVGNFVENFSIAQKGGPGQIEKEPGVVKESAVSAARAQQKVTAEKPSAVVQPVPAEKPAPTPTLQFTQYAPTPDTGVIENRKVVGNPMDQLNIGITATGQFGINPQVNQARLIGDGMKSLEKFFDFQMPTGAHKLSKVGLAEPGQMEQTAEGWKIVKKGQLELTDTAGNVYCPQLAAAQQSMPAQVDVLTSEAKPASLLTSDSMQKAKEAFQQRNHEVTQHTIPGTGFTKADLPVELLGKMGVQVDELERSGQLAKLLKGEKTDLISSFTLRGEQGEPIPFAAKLVLRRDAAGAPSLQFDLPKHTLVIPEQILGKDITPVMKEQLATTGVVPLAEGFRDGQGKTFAAYVAVDKEMNRVVAVRREGIELPKQVLGVQLSPQQNKQLLDGYPTRVEGMTNAKNQVFDAVVQLDPIKRQLTFRDAQLQQAQQQQEEKQQAPRAKVRL